MYFFRTGSDPHTPTTTNNQQHPPSSPQPQKPDTTTDHTSSFLPLNAAQLVYTHAHPNAKTPHQTPSYLVFVQTRQHLRKPNVDKHPHKQAHSPPPPTPPTSRHNHTTPPA
ncbi:hypothetical protein TVAGG3_0823670 [Trichomonas vaginalis G3]|uniref:hypothetical protein n=1 Tax=Trichomonas vaginalis (strain ATCC PRA-98 / G3) TaxID=412133 RepID=UPI0021E5B3A4|nr:hypothetical protein TVAGG3_0823670 [Trichomonas vaginalis G3]KAI5498060.1 hypothetical protein TVAGG3_0823670 [Trichomonas vaginalis G3]